MTAHVSIGKLFLLVFIGSWISVVLIAQPEQNKKSLGSQDQTEAK